MERQFGRNGFRPRIERGELHFLERFTPPSGDEAPAHGHERALAIGRKNGVDRYRRTNVVARSGVAPGDRASSDTV